MDPGRGRRHAAGQRRRVRVGNRRPAPAPPSCGDARGPPEDPGSRTRPPASTSRRPAHRARARRRAAGRRAARRSPASRSPANSARHLGDRRVQENARADGVGAERHRTRDVGGEAPFGRAAREKARARRDLRLDAVDPEGPPVGAGQIPGDQVPAPPGVNQSGRLDLTGCRRPVVAAVAERQPRVLSGGRGDRGQRLPVDGGAAAGERDDCRVQRREPTAQAGRQHLFQLGERAQGDLLHPGDAAGGGGPQAERHRERLLVVEQQRRQLRPGAEAVAARHARGRVHGIAEAAQAIDVAAERARGDLQPAAELATGPGPT